MTTNKKIFEDKYPGNISVLTRLLESMDGGGLVAFTGAGTSMPDLPSWGKLVETLVSDAKNEGRLDESTASTLNSEETDYLYIVDEIYNAVGKDQTKAKVAKIFSSLHEPNSAHELIARINFDRIMTLNYDLGIEAAFSNHLSRHMKSFTALNSNEFDEWIRCNVNNKLASILHWHGIASDASSIILSGSDYIDFYDTNRNNKEALRNIFKSKCVLMIGFGFSDPFIERELNSVMQPLPAANNHYAIIGYPAEKNINTPLERRKYSSKYKLETIFYPVYTVEGVQDHGGLISILEELRSARPVERPSLAPIKPQEVTSERSAALSYRSNLFTIGDRQIYCEPNIWQSMAIDNSPDVKVTVSTILDDASHCVIRAPHEFGLTNLGRKISWDLELAGVSVIFRDADSLPKFQKGILSDIDFSSIDRCDEFTVVLDNFSAIEHQRLTRELISSFKNIKIIALQHSNHEVSFDDGLTELSFTRYRLDGLTRGDIRNVVNIISPENNSDLSSLVVDKVYTDLLQLCIPLTPSNVIMYSTVLCKDGNFSPVSRLHIVEKFTSNALMRASDAYSSTFNAINKLDLISEFCYGIFINNSSSFTNSEWDAFCKKFKNENLVEFSHASILSDLVVGRIIWRDGASYNFRYRMFFSYFVGRHISSRDSLMKDCLSSNKHLELDGLIEVLCGLLHDSSAVIDDLTGKLSGSLEEFYEKYPIKGLDFHSGVKWERSIKEEALWESVNERIENGPVTSQELDELKTSIHAERRTDDQKVSIIKFIASEKSVALMARYLEIALESAKHATASSKKAAATTVIACHTLAYEVASVFVPLIAERKYVSWNGFTYINLIEDNSNDGSDPDAGKQRMRNLVTFSIPFAVARQVADSFGSRKLGQVFLSLLDKHPADSSISKFLLFNLLLRSKPEGWLGAVKRAVAGMNREDIYLRHQLSASLSQYKEEINTESERSELKELVAAIRLRREANVKAPSNTEIKRVIGRLDAKGYWDSSGTSLKNDGDD